MKSKRTRALSLSSSIGLSYPFFLRSELDLDVAVVVRPGRAVADRTSDVGSLHLVLALVEPDLATHLGGIQRALEHQADVRVVGLLISQPGRPLLGTGHHDDGTVERSSRNVREVTPLLGAFRAVVVRLAFTIHDHSFCHERRASLGRRMRRSRITCSRSCDAPSGLRAFCLENLMTNMRSSYLVLSRSELLLVRGEKIRICANHVDQHLMKRLNRPALQNS